MKNICCEIKKKSGIKEGIIYGLIPHSFCIIYIVLSVLGFAAGTAFLGKFISNFYFFPFLVSLSIIFFILSMSFFLIRKKELSIAGIKNNWKYLLISGSLMLLTNLVFLFIIFPLSTKIQAQPSISLADLNNFPVLKIKVSLPCVGHAPLVSDVLNKVTGIKKIDFDFNDTFTVSYDPQKITEDEILNLSILKEFKTIKI